MTITIKIGSNVLTRADGALNRARMARIVDQISTLRQQGHQVLLVSSGSVAGGRSLLKNPKSRDVIAQRQLWSAIGQAQLMHIYSDLFDIYALKCAQILVTKDDFRDRKHYLNLTNCLEALLEDGIVPIINENDAISVTELMFTDNDELSAVVAAMSGSSHLLILTNVDGIFDGPPSCENSKLITNVHPEDEGIEENIQTSKSFFGRGGMITKYNTARKMADQGIEVIIANGMTDDVILGILGNENFACTRFWPSKKQSPVKKWIAHSEGFEKGRIIISAPAIAALTSSRAASLLPVGVVDVVGEFCKNDIVRIESENGQSIALGRTSFSSEKLCKIKGKKGERYVVHYDYLFLQA